MTIAEAETLAHAAIRRRCDAAGKPYPPMPRVRLNRRLTVTNGKARAEGLTGPLAMLSCRIDLGRPWLSAVDQTQTVIHEAMHIVDFWLHGSSSHGWRWALLMHAEGRPAQRYTQDPGSMAAAERVRTAKMRWLHCPCASHRVTQRRASRLARPGVSMRCRLCGLSVTHSHPTPEQVERRLQEKAA